MMGFLSPFPRVVVCAAMFAASPNASSASELLGLWILSEGPDEVEELIGKAEIGFAQQDDRNLFAMYGGCNRHLGEYTETEGSFDFHVSVSTRMACPDDVLALANRFFALLETAGTYNRARGSLTLQSKDGEVVLRFEEKPD